MRKTELLCPASSLEVLKIAVIFGADAVYIGGEAFGLRAKAKNFTKEEMEEGIIFAHERGVRVYVTANILAHNYDLEGAREYFRELAAMKESPDALIISDPGMFTIAQAECPQIDIHISTQANNTNYETYLFWKRMGATRVVSARELSLREIKEIRDRIPEEMEIETFIHGAMCISYSGRCLLSNFFTGRDANHGACTHPCRWKYAVVEESRPGEYLPVYENERGSYIFNSKDLCMIEHVPDLMASGIDSFKIEGRMKTEYYVATVVNAYRRVMDGLMTPEEGARELDCITHRPYSTGFYFNQVKYEHSNDAINRASCIFVGTALNGGDGEATVCQRNKFSVGDTLEVLSPGCDVRSFTVDSIKNADGVPMQTANNAKQIVTINCPFELHTDDILRRREESVWRS